MVGCGGQEFSDWKTIAGARVSVMVDIIEIFVDEMGRDKAEIDAIVT